MKKALIVVALLIGFCIQANAQSQHDSKLTSPNRSNKNPLMASDTVVWAGLDYSMVRMIGTNDFQVPDMIFPGMLERWNALFIEERIDKVAHLLGKRVVLDMNGVTKRNKTATTAQIILAPGTKDLIEQSHITSQDIATAVRSYELDRTNGLGLVFIVDRFCERSYVPVPPHQYGSVGVGSIWGGGGAVYVVFFDVATREVISVERQIRAPGGSGFRNYWFGVIKRVDATLGKYR
jgi:hypothetical protein